MLRLNLISSLKSKIEDVILKTENQLHKPISTQKFPKQHIKLPKRSPSFSEKEFYHQPLTKYKSYSQEMFLTEEEKIENVVLVGYSTQGQLLIARDSKDIDGEMKTFIDVLDISPNKRTNIYKHYKRFTCVSASLNYNHSILALTTSVQNEETSYNGIQSIKQNYYQSYIVILGNKAQIIETSAQNKLFQTTFFLPHQHGKKYDSFIFILDRSMINICRIYFKYKSNERIFHKITSKKEISNGFVWYEYNPIRKRLFFIKNKGPFYELVGWLFHSRPTKLQTTWVLDIPFYYNENRVIPLKYDHNFFTTGFNSPNNFTNLKTISISNNITCLCFQVLSENLSDNNLKIIHISVWILERNERLDLEIPLNNCSLEFIQKVHVFFGAIDELLLLYIPGIYILFLDCSSIHDTSDSLLLTDPQYTTSIEKMTDPKDSNPANISAIYTNIPQKESQKLTTPMENYLIDQKTLLIYSYRFDRNQLINLVKSKSNQIFCQQVLHIAFIHIRDQRFFSSILMHLCLESPESISQLFMKEYIVGATFHNILEKTLEDEIQSVKKILLDLVPLSTISTYRQELDRKKRNEPTKSFRQNFKKYGHSQIQGQNTETIQRFEHHRLVKTVQKLYSKRLISQINQNEYDLQRTNQTPQSKKKNKMEIHPQQIYREILSSHINHYIQIPSISFKLADTYIKAQIEELENLFKIIVKNLITFPLTKARKNLIYCSISDINCCENIKKNLDFIQNQKDSNEKSEVENIQSIEKALDDLNIPEKRRISFQVLQNFYSAIEDLRISFPKEFHFHYCRLSYLCLSRDIFLQYLDSGIIQTDPDFIMEILQKFGSSKEDLEFKNHLISSVPNFESFLKILSKYPENYKYLIEYLSSQISQEYVSFAQSEKFIQVIDFQNSKNDSDEEKDDFVVLLIILNKLEEMRNKKPNEISFIEKYAKESYSTEKL
ncbi:gamma-secretase-activating protein [Anaeramoeba ignava]|uniref:Gamma-secretase-activating protein n=1 Tax=Anaeramoeba ignava TaxID=1746090 RepID=A0A9Q0R818_ANAIG|nr:gamma-secretase-activating protein [Anaeramoeba ignava]